MSGERIKDFGMGLGFVVLQIVLFRHLRVYDMQADLVLVFLLWFMMRRDRTSAIIMAAFLGFVQDAILDLWGLNMFSKTLLAFAGYNFLPKNSDVRLILGQVFIIVFIASVAHNLIFLGMSSVVQNYSAEFLFWRQLIGNSIYTGFVASFIQLFRT